MRNPKRLSVGVCALALLAFQSGPAFAQTLAGSTDSKPSDESGDDIVVTGSRVARSGFDAPSPTTMLTTEDLQVRGLNNVGSFLNELPAFRPSSDSNSAPQIAYGTGQIFADLRGLGSIRTLTLVDGRRHAPTTATGQVDLNMIPTTLIERVDVVTGGASAAYGSDAISGVVNVILNKRLEGIKGEISNGITEYGDRHEYQLALAYGTKFADGRGHVVVGGEYVHQDGIANYYSRPWSRREEELVSYTGARGPDQPSRFYGTGVQPVNMSFGGVILGANADTNPANGVDVLRGIQFGPGGTIQPFTYGTTVGLNSINFTGGTKFLSIRNSHQMVIPNSHGSVMAYADFEVSDAFKLFGEFTYAYSGSIHNEPSVRDQPSHTSGNVVIRQDNAFLPDPIRTIMEDNGIQSFFLGRQYNDFGPVVADARNDTFRGLIGAEGDLGNGWSYDTYAQFGRNKAVTTVSNLRIEQRFRFAYDAIEDPVTGEITCRALTSADPAVRAAAAGCVPMNIFGEGSPSAASIAYATGQIHSRVVTEQQVAAFNVRGEPLSTWAGPVSIAFGAEYRHEKAVAKVDALSAASAFNYLNPKGFAGSYNVKEGYVETVIPLAKDTPLLQSLEFNGALRYTDYSRSGGVTTWKAGLTWEPVVGVTLRGTRSRDIRAPNNAELYSETAFRTGLRNPFTGATENIDMVTPPATSLKPEAADTTTLGIVFQPRAIPRLRFSIDAYRIEINNAIGSYPAQVVLDRCGSEVTAGAPGFFCSFVTRTGTGTSTAISAVRTPLLNIAALKAQGLDVELRYWFPLTETSSISARFFATYVDKLISDDGLGIPRTYNAAGVIQTVGSVVNRAGQTGGFGAVINSSATSAPHWTLNGGLTYQSEGFALDVQGRYVGGGVIDATLVGPDNKDYDPASPISIGDNRMSGRFYLNLSASVDVLETDGRKLQLYAVVNNLTNVGPPSPSTAFAGLYDKLGRAYKVGARFAF